MERHECIHTTFVFNENPLTIIEIDDEPRFIVKQLGDILGYAEEGRALNRQLTNEWADRVREGHHHVRLEGDALARLKNMGGAAPHVDPQSKSLLLLTEAGLYRVLMLSGKPAALQFQDWLDSEVLPALRRTGTHTLPNAPTRPAALPDASTLPPALRDAPAGAVLELLSAEHAVGHELPALRAMIERGHAVDNLLAQHDRFLRKLLLDLRPVVNFCVLLGWHGGEDVTPGDEAVLEHFIVTVCADLQKLPLHDPVFKSTLAALVDGLKKQLKGQPSLRNAAWGER